MEIDTPIENTQYYTKKYIKYRIKVICNQIPQFNSPNKTTTDSDSESFVENLFGHIIFNKNKNKNKNDEKNKQINLTRKCVTRMIDHTMLKGTARISTIKQMCDEAVKYDFASVCVNGCHVKWCADYLKGKKSIATVVGFPLGANSIETKKFEAMEAFKNGANEVDMVLNISKLMENDYKYVYDEIKAVCSTKKNGNIVKVILETCYLSFDDIIDGCILSVLSGADFVKTSTGFGTSGAKLRHVKLMKRVVGESAQVKASGGIHGFEGAKRLIKGGATRLGCSSCGISIIKGGITEKDY